jgi:molybdopterin converting factor small subunit
VQVEVKLFASLRRFRPPEAQGSTLIVELADDATVQNLLDKLGISNEEAEIILIKGLRAELSVPLKEGAQVSLFPMLGGG